jgi:60 kDa SS-A/Ro ribonucleoprotein
MARLNQPVTTVTSRTHEGAPAVRQSALKELRRTVLTCLLWEDTFYEQGSDIADRIQELVLQCNPQDVFDLAIEARTEMHLRHVPLFLVSCMASSEKHKVLVRPLLNAVIQRADELAEFLAIYWRKGKTPIAAQVKKGLADCFLKFSEYDFAKYNRDSAIKLRDVLFLCHAKPETQPQEKLFKAIVENTLKVPFTWEVELSSKGNTNEVWTELLERKALGGLAFIRNLRNMTQAGITKPQINNYSSQINSDRVLPFRYIAAARYNPTLEDIIEPMMFRSLDLSEKLNGHTVLCVDNSGSMYGTKVSRHSDIDRSDAACALAVLLREICEIITIIPFGTSAGVIAPRRGFALIEQIKRSPYSGGTNTATAVNLAKQHNPTRIIVITDEQSATAIPGPNNLGYVINVATYQNSIATGKWHQINGWSESIIRYIQAVEKEI